MERQHSYKPALQAQPGNIREAHVQGPMQAEGAGHSILRAAAALGGEFMNIVARDYNREMQGRMDDSILAVNADFEKWKTQYKATRQGVDALTAQKDFADKYMELADQAAANFGGNKNEVYLGELKRALAKNGLYAVKEGGAYQLQQDEAWQQSQWNAQLSSFKKIVDENPDDPERLSLEAGALLQSWLAKNPGKDPGAIKDEISSLLANGRVQSLIARKDYAGAEKLLCGKSAGFALAPEESGQERQLAIGYDPNGGTSYGTWQLSSRQGSFGEWLEYLSGHSGKGAAIARQIRAAGPLNTGGKSGAAVEAYKRLARENPELFEQTQHEYLLKSHYGPALRSLAPNQRAMIEQTPALGEMLFSTAVQHGGAAKIFKNAWQEGMGKAELVRAVYAKRADPANFRSTPQEMAKNITEGRFPREQEKVLAMLRDGSAMSGLTSVQRQHYLEQIEGLRKREASEARAGLDAAISDYIAAAQDGNAASIKIDSSLVAGVYGEKADKILTELNDYAQLSDAIQKLKITPDDEIGRTIQNFTPEGEGYAQKRKFREQYRQIASQHLQERQKNPTGYLMSVNPELQNAYNEMLQGWKPEAVSAYLVGLAAASEQLKLGQAPIFPKDQAQAISANIMASADPGQTLAIMQNGFGRHWGKAFQELSAKDCLPVAAQVVGNNLPSTDAKLLMEAVKDKDFHSRFFELHKNASFTKAVFESAVLDAMQEFSETILGGGDQAFAVELEKSVASLAMQYINSQNLNYNDAIEKAANVIAYDRYSIMKVNGGKFRVPKAFDGDRVEKGADLCLKSIADNAQNYHTLALPELGEHAGLMYRNMLTRNGRWVTNEDESGLYLFVGSEVVREKSGKPVMRPWHELERLGEKGINLEEPEEDD